MFTQYNKDMTIVKKVDFIWHLEIAISLNRRVTTYEGAIEFVEVSQKDLFTRNIREFKDVCDFVENLPQSVEVFDITYRIVKLDVSNSIWLFIQDLTLLNLPIEISNDDFILPIRKNQIIVERDIANGFGLEIKVFGRYVPVNGYTLSELEEILLLGDTTEIAVRANNKLIVYKI